MEGLRDEICSPYHDDVLVYSQSFTQHLQHVRTVLRRLRQHGIKLKARKCNFFEKDIGYLDHIASSDGYHPDNSNIKAVTSFLDNPPKTVGKLRKILGILGYFRRYIRNFAEIAKPLTDLLKVPKTKETKTLEGGQLASNEKIIWRGNENKSLKTLIDAITNPPSLSCPDFSRPFELYTDASKDGLGAILCQNIDGKLSVIGYACRTKV